MRDQYEVGFYNGDEWVMIDSGTRDYCLGVAAGREDGGDIPEFYSVRDPNGGTVTGPCTHERTLHLEMEGDDRNMTRWFDDTGDHGYLPYIEGLCGGDDLKVTLCIDCGILVNLPPVEKILAAKEDT